MTAQYDVGGKLSPPAILLTMSIAIAMPLDVTAQTVAGADTSVGAIAATNPYLLETGDTGEVGVNITLRPWISLTEDDTTVTLDGAVYLESFLDGQRIEESVQFGGSMEHRANERTTITADLGLRSSESAARRYFGGTDLGDLEPGEFPDDPIIDPSLGTLSGRTSRFDVNIGVDHRISSNEVLGLSVGGGRTEVDARNGEDYRDASAAGSYSRSLNPRTSLRATINAGYADYLGRRAGDGHFVTTLVGVDHQLTESMYASAQIGISYSVVETLPRGRDKTTNWAALVDLCDLFARGRLCVNGSRAVQPTSLGGLTTVSAIGASYSRSVGSNGSMSLSAKYSRSSRSENSAVVAGRPRSRIAHVNGAYSHRLGERVSAFVTPSFTSSRDELFGSRENYEIIAGITYHWGARR